MRKHTLLVNQPHPQSLAMLVLLNKEFQRERIQHWLAFRAEFLAHERARVGDLVCVYCGCEGLVENVDENAGKQEMKRLATIDHIDPRANGGAEYDYANLAVACRPCNEKKKDKILGRSQTRYSRK